MNVYSEATGHAPPDMRASYPSTNMCFTLRVLFPWAQPCCVLPSLILALVLPWPWLLALSLVRLRTSNSAARNCTHLFSTLSWPFSWAQYVWGIPRHYPAVMRVILWSLCDPSHLCVWPGCVIFFKEGHGSLVSSSSQYLIGKHWGGCLSERSHHLICSLLLHVS